MIFVSLLAVAGLSGAADQSQCGEVEGHFRGRFWHFYERGVSYADCEMWDRAEADFREAVAQREADQMMAKTYGLNFIDYFPHRELGIALFKQGKRSEALPELEKSYGQQPSERAAFYLNLIHKEEIESRGGDQVPPEITIESPGEGSLVSDFRVKIEGIARDQGRVQAVTVNGRPAHIDLAVPERRFSEEIPVPEDGVVTVTVEDLLGNLQVAKLSLKVDREGPQVVIEEVTSPKPGHYRIRGVALDPSGIAAFRVGNREIQKQGPEVRFEEEIEAALGIFSFEASDRAGNRTRGSMKEFGWFKKAGAPARVRYAQNGMPARAAVRGREPVFVAQSGAPSIQISSVKDKQTVYIDKLVVEGVARSAKPVTQLAVQNRSILQRPGQQVYFSTIIPLSNGNNSIKVKAVDQDRQQTESQVNIRREVPAVHQVKSRYSIAVMPLGGPRANASAQAIYSKLLFHLSNLERFDLLEREKLDLVLAEMELSSTRLVDPASSVQAGKMIAASGMLIGQINARGSALEVVVRLVDTETSEILLSREAYVESTDLKAIDGLCERLAWKIRQAFPLVEGNILKVSGKTVYTDLTTQMGVFKNMQVIVFKLGEEIRGANGQLLGADTEEKGVAVVMSADDKFSKADLKPGKSSPDIAPGMRVITR